MEWLTVFKRGGLRVSGRTGADHGYKYLEVWHKKEDKNDHLEQEVSYSQYKVYRRDSVEPPTKL